MRLFLNHVLLHQRSVWRRPLTVVVNVVLPVMIYYSVVNGKGYPTPVLSQITVSFMAFAVLGAMFNQFGSSLSEERNTVWSEFVSTLPVRNVELVGARLASGALVTLVAPIGLYIFACAATSLVLPLGHAARILATLLLAAVPFGFMAFATAVYFPRRLAIPLTQFAYYPLVYWGGLWSYRSSAPDLPAGALAYLPTRHLAELGWAALELRATPLGSWTYLALLSLLFGGLSILGVRRQRERE